MRTSSTTDAVPSRLARAGRRRPPSRAERRVHLGLLVLGGALALAGCSSSGSSEHAAPATDSGSYGSLPTFLPSSSVDADSVLTGDAAHPALTTEGDSVEVRLAGASVLATVSGPVVPGEGLPQQTDSTTCTWTVTLSRATSTVPVRIADFTTLDHLGTVYPTHLAPGSAPPPTRLGPGRIASFSLRTVMPTGEGLMRWTAGGTHIVASWDFEVEND